MNLKQEVSQHHALLSLFPVSPAQEILQNNAKAQGSVHTSAYTLLAVMFSSFGLAPHFSAAIYSQLAEVLPPRISLPNSGLSMVLWG